MGWGGKLLFSCSEGLEMLPIPELAEAIAARGALMMARDKGFQKIIMVSDCLSLVQRISSPSQDRSMTGSVVGDIKNLMTGSLAAAGVIDPPFVSFLLIN
uniref:Uncharacterized protein n=1 Tax=Avena sativa TaxID=4498 RepID=A0ACD5YZ07_AVESA